MFRKYTRRRKGGVVVINNDSKDPDNLNVTVNNMVTLLEPQLYLTGDVFETGAIACAPVSVSLGNVLKNIFSINRWGADEEKKNYFFFLIGINNNNNSNTGVGYITIHNSELDIYTNIDRYFVNFYQSFDEHFAETSTHFLIIPVRAGYIWSMGINDTLPIVKSVANAEYLDLYKSANVKYITPYRQEYTVDISSVDRNNVIFNYQLHFLNKIVLDDEDDWNSILITRNSNQIYEYFGMPALSYYVSDSLVSNTYYLTTVPF